jgi:NAD(P) transhydrogenase subunit alpha
MVVGILKEHAGENRVVCLPEIVAKLKALKADVLVEKGAGNHSYVSDEEYEAAGAAIASRDEVLQKSSILLQINRPEIEEVKRLREGLVWVSIVQPLFNKDLAIAFAESGISCFALDMIPRTTRAQAMDILSSQATAGGYKAVLTAALHLPKFFPMFMTAAGTITPAKVLILGAGVAGLQAISTARRLGAVVEAFDTRSAVKEEVQSLGAKFIEVEGAVDSSAAGGYAVEQTEEYKQRQRQKIHESAVKSDVIITTAQIPGRTAPILITKETVAAMKKGSVIVDMAASTGGNCELTKNGEILEVNGVKIIGDSNLPGTIPQDASKMFGKNVLNFLQLIITKEGEINLNFDDDLVVGCCVSHQKEIIHPKVKEIINQVEA